MRTVDQKPDNHLEWPNRDHPGNQFTKHSNITHAKNRLGRQGLAQKAPQTFFDNTSIQRNIVESINNRFLNFQQLAKSAHFSIFIAIHMIFLFRRVTAKLRGHPELKPT